MKVRAIVVIVFLLISSFAAVASSEMVNLFTKSFYTHYESGRCGDNIIGLLSEAHEQGIDISKARILEISNKGYSVFGLLNVEFARESGRRNPDYPNSGLANLPGERNWYHHVVLEHNGLIFDFDFGNTPSVVSVADYFEKMFLIEKKREEGGNFYVGREEKLNKYAIVNHSAEAVIEARRNNMASPKAEDVKLCQYLFQVLRISNYNCANKVNN